jgi:hypothetical protein
MIARSEVDAKTMNTRGNVAPNTIGLITDLITEEGWCAIGDLKNTIIVISHKKGS